MRISQIFLLSILLSCAVARFATEDGSESSTTQSGSSDRMKLLSFLARFLSKTFDNAEIMSNAGEDRNITVMSWNLLAPMWIDREAIKSRGVINLNLLNDEVRLKIQMQRILDEQPDVLTLQEVQEETYEEIKEALSTAYEPAAFAPNIKEYWKEFLPNGTSYKKNGVAIFYKKNKISLSSHTAFETSDQGSIALAAVLREQPPNSKGGRPIVLVTCHLDSAVSAAGVVARTTQGNAIFNEVQKQLEQIESREPGSQPVVVITGDLNTQRPFPGFSNFISKGYLDAFEEVGKLAVPTLYYEFPLQLPGVAQATDWTSIDRVFIRSTDKASARAEVQSVHVPDINSEDFSEKAYVRMLTDILVDELNQATVEEFWKVMRSDLFATLIAVVADGMEGSNNANRALRMGSDHLPVRVKLTIS